MNCGPKNMGDKINVDRAALTTSSNWKWLRTARSCGGICHACSAGNDMRRTNQAYITRHMPRQDYLLFGAIALAKRGAALPQARLDVETVRLIRANTAGKTARQLAQQFGVYYRTIEKVRHYETWTHV